MKQVFVLQRFELLLSLSLVVLVAGCDYTQEGGEPTAGQTRILRIEQQPSPVAVGETVTFRVVIEDSLDTRFRYYWVLAGQRDTVVTTTNTVQWKAPSTPGTYEQGLMLDNGDRDYYRPLAGFRTIVVRR